MEQKVAVAYQINGPMAVEEFDMATQMIGSSELRYELIDDSLLFLCKIVRAFGIDGGEVACAHLPGGAVDIDGAVVCIDLVEQQTILHVELGVAHDDLPLELEQQDVDGFDERCDAVVGVIGLVCEGDKGAQRDAIIVFEDLVVVIAQIIAQDADDARFFACGGSHP